MAQLTTQICGVFRVPAWKAGNLDKRSYSNMESSALDYATSTGASFGFKTVKDAWTRDGATTVCILLDIQLFEISLTATPVY